MEVFDQEKVNPEEALNIGTEIASVAFERLLTEKGVSPESILKKISQHPKGKSPYELPIRRGWVGMDKKLLENN